MKGESMTLKQVADVSLGGYCIELSSDSLEGLYDVKDHSEWNVEKLDELIGCLLDWSADGDIPQDGILCHVAHLRTAVRDYKFLQSLVVDKACVKGGVCDE